MASLLKEPPSPKPRASRTVAITLVLAVCTVAALLHQRPAILSRVERLSPCGRIVLVTAARHGSTWFISSAEGCTAQGSTSFGNLNSQTELWVNHKTSLTDMAPSVAADYVRYNMSVKIMPLAFNRREKDLREFFEEIGRSVPVFVLRRNTEDCYASLEEAKETGKWMRNKVNADDRVNRVVVKDEKYESYRKRLDDFFMGVQRVMKEAGIVWDQIEYEVVSRQKLIVGQRNRCFIKNCNFL